MSKYKKGERVVVKSNLQPGVNYGELVFTDGMLPLRGTIQTVEAIGTANFDHYKLSGFKDPWFTNEMIERKADMFTKDDLKTGMVVELRDGCKCIVLKGTKHGDILHDLANQTHVDLTSYTQDMKCVDMGCIDIMSVFQTNYQFEYLSALGEVIWQRIEAKKITVEEAVSKLQEAFGESFEITVTK